MTISEDRYVVEVTFAIEKDAEGYPKSRDLEALLCEPLNEDCSVCKVASVPFYLRNVAYGDTISTGYDPSQGLRFNKVLGRGSYGVYRVLLHDTGRKQELIEKLTQHHAAVEQQGDLIAFALADTADSDGMIDYMLEGKEKGYWGAQDGFIFE